MRKWKRLSTKPLGNFRVFSVRQQRNQSPESGKEGDFFVIDAGNWVNVIPLTADEEVILVEQYRHGTDEVTLEIPGGCIDPEDPSPLVAGQRELAEETGYTSEEWIELGCNTPNPALFSNRCYTFLARNARLTRPQKLDGNEEINVRKVPLSEIGPLIAQGKITHSLVITGFYYFDLWRKTQSAE